MVLSIKFIEYSPYGFANYKIPTVFVFLLVEMFNSHRLMFFKLYIDWSAVSLLMKFKDVLPGYAQHCYMFNKLLFEMSHVILLSVKYNLRLAGRFEPL